MFAVLYVPDFALQAVLRTRPGSWGAAALIESEGRPPRLLACTTDAHHRGVAVGQTASQALSLCPDLLLVTPEPAWEREAAAALLATAFTIAPLVEATAAGVYTIQLDGLPADRRDAAIEAALSRLQVLGFLASAGSGPTPLLALQAARQGPGYHPITDQHRFLDRLPLAVAEPSDEHASILARWGIRTLGALTALPKAEVGRRLGPEGAALWDRAAGTATRPLQPIAPPPAFSAEVTCEFAFETLEPVLFLLRRLVDRLALDLANAALAAISITLELKLDDERTLPHTLRLPEPTTGADTLFRTLQSYLETVRTEAPVVGLAIRLEPGRRSVRQRGLFDRALRDPHGFAETLARLGAVVGSERVGTPVMEDSHRPDAVRLVAPAMEIPPAPEREPVHPARGLVLRRYRPPVPVTIVLADNRPEQVIRENGRTSAIASLVGPWPTSGEWWEAGRAWTRVEWDVAVEDDGLYRLVRTPQGFFIEGEYD